MEKRVDVLEHKLFVKYSSINNDTMVRATATVVWYRFRFSRENKLTKEVGILFQPLQRR